MNNNLIELFDIKKSFKDGENQLEIIKGIDLTIKEFEIIGVIGPSGAGKSTLLHMIGGLSKPTSGEVKYEKNNIYIQNGKKLSNFRNQYIGFIFQFHYLLPEFTALENVTIPLLIRHENFDTARDKASSILKELGLESRMGHRPNELSGGEQQRVAIARAMVTIPRFILADEPTGNLDRENSEKVQELLINLARQKKQTVIIVTHNETLAKNTDRIIRILDGKIEK